MANLPTTSLVTFNDALANLELYKTNPSAMQRKIWDIADEVSGNLLNIVDPTNPFVLLMECSVINTTLAVNESVALLAKQYPILAQTQDDLYHHMSDVDYINRFAVPSNGGFVIQIKVLDIMNRLVYDQTEDCYKATIPRDTQFLVDDSAYIFTTLYPIDIRRFNNGVVQFSYDTSITSPIAGLSTNIIPYTVRRDNGQIDWAFLNIDVPQFWIKSENTAISTGQGFSEDYPYSDQFYLARAFYRNAATNNEWKEMKVTHSDRVYDPFDPTAVLRVYDTYVNVTLPQVYLTTGLISGQLRFDIYQTKGAIAVDLSNYQPNSFTMKLTPIDEERDINEFVTAMNNITYYGYSSDYVTGGTSSVDFETLRERVITNSVGPQIIPISPTAMEAKIESNGFTMVKNVDALTNRIFLATQKLPKPSNTKLATSANIGIASFISTMDYLETLSSVATNVDRCTILSSNLYQNNNGIISILTPDQVAALKALPKVQLTQEVNNKSYLYSPYYYVLDDTDNEFAVRAYDLDFPEATGLSFVSQNQTLQLPVNTSSYTFEKTPQGYRLSILTTSGNFYRTLPDNVLFTQLGWYPVGESKMAYVNGVLADKDEDGNRLWTFDLITNYDLNSDDNLTFTNGRMFDLNTLNTWVELSQTFHIFYATTSVTPGFEADDADALLGKFILPNGAVADTHETLELSLGLSLKNLWTRSRSMVSGLGYQVYLYDEPAYYEETTYVTNPVTGSVLFFDDDNKPYRQVEHEAGDPVLDADGNQTYVHRKGEVIIDPETGLPIPAGDQSISKEMDMLFVDGRNYFVTDPAFLAYNNELVGVLDSWIVDDLASIQETALEQTFIYFYPKSNLSQVKVLLADQGQDLLDAGQSFVVDLYVTKDVYTDTEIRSQLTTETVNVLDTYVSGSVVNMNEVNSALTAIYGSSVKSHRETGLGGSKNYQIVTLADEQYRLTLKKILDIQLDGKLIIREDVTVNFYLVT